MRLIVSLTAALAVCAYSNLAQAQTAPADGAAPAAAAAAAPAPTTFQLLETSWTFTRDGKNIQESIDAKGNYIANTADGKHVDHGTSLMKGDKACFDSAMDKEGEVCWTTKAVEIGQSMDTVSDKGEKLTVARVAYVPLTMPK
jgi:hypothetical protein